jgi:hypothetical protein
MWLKVCSITLEIENSIATNNNQLLFKIMEAIFNNSLLYEIMDNRRITSSVVIV